MKRYLLLAVMIAGLVVSLLYWRGRQETSPTSPDTVADAPALTNTSEAPPVTAIKGHEDQKQRLADPETVRALNETHNVPVTFHGLVVDQDSNALQSVTIGLDVREEYLRPFPQGPTTKMISFQRQTGTDGRFELSGPKGRRIVVKSLAKEGYEPELMLRHHGEYGPRSGSIDEPIVFRMWSTNLHAPLIGGEKSFAVIPDGRHYAIDLVKGAIAEGDEGDLVAWIKRSEPVRGARKYDWSCELKVPAGGLVEDSNYAMFKAPEAGYTNAFAHQSKADTHGWGPLTGEKRFYLKLRNGQMYGRIIINLYAEYRNQPALIRLSYAVNPSGSRILR